MTLKGGFELDEGIRLEVRPQKVNVRLPALTTSTIDSEIALTTPSAEEPIILFGSESSHRIQVFDVGVQLGIKGEVNQYEAIVSLKFAKAEVVIDTSDADGFITMALGSGPIKIEIKDSSIIWSSKTGLHFGGHAGLELIVPIDRTISAVRLQNLTLGLKASTSNGISLTVGLTGSTKIGPVMISVENVGMIMSLEPLGKDQPPGAFIDLDFSIGFKPPNGLGIALDVNGVKGGGFILKNQNEYSGVIDLNIRGLSIQALALLDTKDFSILFAIFSTFRSPIQIGGGWKITKIGGLIGLDRTVSLSEIASGIRSGLLDSILFPDNVIQNAPRIISDFKRVFPSHSGQHLIGPTIRIVYGTPVLIKGDIALILEFPNPFQLSVIGRITSKIPDEDHPIVRINLGILGSIDFSNDRLGVYGSLYDSKILGFALSGDMAMAADWGSGERNFIISLGGFNPRFKPPSNFPPFNAPPLKRLSVAFSSSVTLQCYLALTSNTLQIGARVDASFSNGATISGFLSFDALIQFDPLYYIVDVAAGFSVKYSGHSLASIKFSGSIEGPNPHRIKGSVTFSIFWWDISVDVDKTFGTQKPEPIVSVNPWDVLKEALQQNDSWVADLPAWATNAITVKELSQSELASNINNDDNKTVLVHPIGTLKVTQKVVPLNYTLTKFGITEPKDNFRFKIDSLVDESANLVNIQDYFAPAQFSNYDNTQKLSLKSFDSMDSGVMFGADYSDISCPIESVSYKQMEYETIMIPEQPSQQVAPHFPMPIYAQIFELSSSAYQTRLAQNQLNFQYTSKHQKPAVTVTNEQYVILDTDNNLAIPSESDLQGENSQAKIVNKMQDFKNKNKNKNNLKVFSVFEKPAEILV